MSVVVVVVVSALLAVSCDGCVPPPPPPGEDAGVPVGTPTTIALNEVMSRNGITLRDTTGEFDDWFELFNVTDAPINLDGFTIQDEGSAPQPFPTGITIAAGGFLVAFADDTTDGNVLEPHFNFKLAGEGDALILRDASGELVDSLPFPALGVDKSYGRFPDGDADAVDLGEPTPRNPNNEAGAGEGEGEGEECTPPAPTPVVMNELVAVNLTGLVDPEDDVDDEREPWLELFNPSGAFATLEGYELRANDERWAFPASISVAPGAFEIIFMDGEPEDGTSHSFVALSASTPSLAFGDVCGGVVQTIALTPVGADVSVGLFPDGAAPLDTFTARAQPTPGTANQ